MRKAKMGGGMMMKRPGMKKGTIPPQLKKFVMAKKKKAAMKKNIIQSDNVKSKDSVGRSVGLPWAPTRSTPG